MTIFVGLLCMAMCCLTSIVCLCCLDCNNSPLTPADSFSDEYHEKISSTITNLEQHTIKCHPEDMCAICLASIDTDIYDICHMFHKDCIKLWIQKGNLECPMCFQELTPLNYEFIV